MTLSDDDYYTLDHFIIAALTRVRDGLCSVSEGRANIMRILAAWDKGTIDEIGPWMKRMMAEWEAENAPMADGRAQPT